MDIAAEETSSPLQGVKYVKPFSNFFQASKQRFANADPDSGVHLVGPMFELTACIDKEKSIQDFDAIYPESGVSFGPTICSFGLPYNDHNYALPVGLTPPTMAPHLMDLNIPSLTSRESDLDVNLVTSNETSKHPRDGDSETRTETMTENMEARPETYPHSKCLIKTRGLKPSTLCPKVVTSPTKITPLVFASVADSTAGLSEPKKALFAAWHAKAAASGGTLLVQQRWKAPEAGQQEVATQRQFVKDQSAFSVPRYCKGLIKASDGEGEYRCDLDMKVIEVPDDICVSPSKLSDLESSDEDRDEDDDDDASTVPYLSPCRSVDKLQHKPAIWSTVRCPCEVNVGDAKMQQCLNCRLLQHVECMEVVYGEGARTSEADPAQITPVEVLMDPANYVCATCLRPPFAISSVVLDRIRSAAQQRQSARALGLLPVAGLQSSKGEGVKAPLGGAQLLANATDRARQLGLIGSGGGSRASISSNNSEDRLT
uniref:SET domain-containing protein n=1 Tax=Mesocestoides corti TaxID=53468 RepID=A0A5K3FPI9_MESCO